MKAPKVLADIVEAVVAALFIDLQFDFNATWKVCTITYVFLFSYSCYVGMTCSQKSNNYTTYTCL